MKSSRVSSSAFGTTAADDDEELASAPLPAPASFSSFCPAARSASLPSACVDTCPTCLLIRKRSYSASSSSDSGSSFDAAMSVSSGTLRRAWPLSKSRSLSSVSSALRMAELALKISSTKATSAVGR